MSNLYVSAADVETGLCNEKPAPAPTEDLKPLQRHVSQIQRPQSLLGEILFVAVICSAQLMTQAGLAMSIAPMHYIGDSFGVKSPGELSWFAAGYSLTVGTFILIAGRLGDVFGHKRFFVAGFAWFGLWSLVAGLSVYSTRILFDFSRAMQGIGPAFLLPNAIAILGRTYEPGRRQDMVFSLFGATAPGGFVIGAVFSSLLTQLAWWPWAYWIMCVACLILAVLGFLVIPWSPAPAPEGDTSSIWSRIDLFGCITGVAALVLFNFAWNQGPVVGWTTPYTYITLIIGVLLFALFIFAEKKADYPLLPFGLLRMDSVFSLACIAAGWSSFGVFVLYIWNFLEVLRQQTPLLTTAQFSVVAVSGLCAALTTGFLLGRISASIVMTIAMAAFLTGGILMATLPVNQIYWAQTFVAFIVLPWGMDLSFPAGTILLSRAMPKEHQGLAASLVNTVVNYSISIGLGIAGTVEYNVNDGGRDILSGYRGAWYTGVGMAGLGVFVGLTFCWVEWRRPGSRK
ncbi:Drug resistance protein [Hirsutella minnesotensis 3608]|uniref:Drug resistance protein n=1 Tax=Hirsutella minnesotensis 3608 TaxID=1043627 RepID=A0A0F7ZUS1_9HYPO|nr:Drug resistance protein [Hirsutella minnesotensis 3608]